MSLFIKMFFRSEQGITPKDILSSLLASGLQLTSSSREHWEHVKMIPDSGINFQYDSSLRPIRIYYSVGDSAAKLSNSILDELRSYSSVPPDVIVRLHNAKQSLDLEVNPDSLVEEVWSSLDRFEQDILSKFDGILYVHGEGIYDKQLNKVLDTY